MRDEQIETRREERNTQAQQSVHDDWAASESATDCHSGIAKTSPDAGSKCAVSDSSVRAHAETHLIIVQRSLQSEGDQQTVERVSHHTVETRLTRGVERVAARVSVERIQSVEHG